MTTLSAAGFNPIKGQTASFSFDDELLGDDFTTILRGGIASIPTGENRDVFSKLTGAALRKKLVAKYPEKSNLEITDMVNLALLSGQELKGDAAAAKELARYWGVALTARGKTSDGGSGPLYRNYTEEFLAGKRPWPGAKGGATKPVSKLRVVTPIYRGAALKPSVTTKMAVMKIVRHEKEKKERAKREAACPCKAREKAREHRPRIQFPAAISANLKDVLTHLKYAAIQREATSEHRGKMAEETFREKVLRLGRACSEVGIPREERADVIRVILAGR